MPTRRSTAEARRRSSSSWRARSARFSARGSRTLGRSGIDPFSGVRSSPPAAPPPPPHEWGGEALLEACLEPGLLARFAHLVDALAHVLAALLAPVGVEEIGRRGCQAHPHHQARESESEHVTYRTRSPVPVPEIELDEGAPRQRPLMLVTGWGRRTPRRRCRSCRTWPGRPPGAQAWPRCR